MNTTSAGVCPNSPEVGPSPIDVCCFDITLVS